MSIANPHFESPLWLWLAVLGPVALALLSRYAARAREKQLAQVASAHIIGELTRSHSPGRRSVKHGFLLLSVAMFGLALARPQWGELEQRNRWLGEDVIFVLDCSRSMLATDIQPNRLERAKFAILDFVRRYGTGRVGLVAFAGAAFLQCPLTFDYDAFDEALREVDDRTIPVGGSDIGRGLQEALHAMEKKTTRKRIVLITDGEDLQKSGVKEAEVLAKAGAVVYTIGVGTAAGGELRTMTAAGQFDLVRDEKGQAVRSRLDEETLTAIAKATGGTYQPLGRLGEGLAKVREAIDVVDATGFARTRTQGVERFHIPLAIGLICLVAESLLGTRRRKTTMSSMKRTMQATSAAMAVAVGMTLGSTVESIAVPTTNTFSVPVPPPATARGMYNAGTQKVASGKLAEAETMLQGALAKQDEQVQPLALYNLAHVRFELGREELKKAPAAKPARDRGQRANDAGGSAIQSAEAALAGNNVQQMVSAYMRGKGARKEMRAAYDAVHRALELHGKTLEKWRRSLGDFRGTAELNPADTNALHNAQIVERAIAQLVDSVRQSQMVALQCSGNCSKLGDLLSQLKGKIPADQMPPGAKGKGEEDEDGEEGEPQIEELAGLKEGESKGGREMDTTLSPEEAGDLLEGFKLGGNRRLPMGKGGDRGVNVNGEESKPKDRKLRDW
jgi:Ca-activated chloride channel homolog